MYSHDPERSRQLLADAGYPDGVEAKLVFGGSTGREAEVIQATAKEGGFDLELVQSPPDVVTNFYKDGRMGQLFVGVVPWVGVDRIIKTFAPGFVGNPCNWQDPHMQELQAEIRKLPPASEESVELVREATKYSFEEVAPKVMLGVRPQHLSVDRPCPRRREARRFGPTPGLQGLLLDAVSTRPMAAVGHRPVPPAAGPSAPSNPGSARSPRLDPRRTIGSPGEPWLSFVTCQMTDEIDGR
jgi:hypothetical protein